MGSAISSRDFFFGLAFIFEAVLRLQVTEKIICPTLFDALQCMNYRMVLDKYQDNKTKISITGTNPDLHCDYTMKKASGYITLEPDNGNIIVTYYFHSEPSQNIPTWLINPKIHEMPFQTFKGLRKRLKI